MNKRKVLFMKDYKLSEIKEICQKYYPACYTAKGEPNCPLYEGSCFLDKDYPKDWILDKEFIPMTCFYEPPIPHIIEPFGVELFGVDLASDDCKDH